MLDRRLVRRLVRDGHSVRAVARGLGVSRGAVQRALRTGVASYRRASPLDEYLPAIRAELARAPLMPVAAVAHQIGWPGSLSALAVRVEEVRPPVPTVPVLRPISLESRGFGAGVRGKIGPR